MGLFFAFCPNQTFTFLLLLFAPDFSHLTGGGWIFPDFNAGPPELCAAFDGRDEGPKNGCCCCPSGANGPSVCLSVASERKSNVQSSRIRPQDKSQLRDSRAAGQVLNLLILHPLHLLVPVKHETTWTRQPKSSVLIALLLNFLKKISMIMTVELVSFLNFLRFVWEWAKRDHFICFFLGCVVNSNL